MNYTIILRLLGIILTALCVAMSVSLGIAFFFDGDVGREGGAIRGFTMSIAISASLAVAFQLMSREGEMRMLRKEAITVIGLGWILASLVGALPYYLILPNCSVADAIFESTSGITTTGASVFSGLEGFPRSLLFWRAISQWIGGLGIVVFFVSLLSFLGVGAKILFSGESSASSTELDSPRVRTGILHIMYLYFGLSAICAVAYRFCGLNWFDAICHMFTTVSTAGFSTRTASIGAFDNATFEWTVIFFMFLGGMSFLVMVRVLQGDFRVLLKNSEVKCLLIISLIATLLLAETLLEQTNTDGFHTLIRKSVFQTVSILTTTGYTSADFDAWSETTHAVLLVLMLIGGCSGSTAGGLKIVRVIAAFRICLLNIETAFRTRLFRQIKISGRTIDTETKVSISGYIVLTLFLCFAGMLMVTYLEPEFSMKGTFSAAIACLFNVGPGFSEVGPSQNYGELSGVTKSFLSLLMIMGRVELFPVLVLFVPTLWRRFY